MGQIFGPIIGPIGYFFELILTYPLFNLLMLLDHLFGDLGLSIIVLTVIIRLALFPLYMKQLKSTKATQAIQPLLADVRKKYAKDQRGQYEAMQTLYKEYGINPAAGCLPLLIQLPILYCMFYALKTVLNPTLEGINSIIYPFLPHFSKLPNVDLNWFTFINPHWFISLGSPDPTHILPVLAGVATFIQLRMAQPRNVATSKDAMSQQMQMMQFIMPFITFFFALSFAAGLALYWTTTSVFSMFQQYYVTGWGSLAILPSFLSFLSPKKDTARSNASAKSKNTDSGKSYSGDSRKETQLLQKADEPEGEVVTTQGRAGRNGQASSHTNGASTSSSARHRPRNSSASARRRGNTPKRGASRR